MVKLWVRKTLAVVYLIAFILQVLSIATPGWLIYVHQNVIEKNSLFYRRTCETESLLDAELETCKTESFRYLHLYRKTILKATQASKAELVYEDFDYNAKICRQVLIVVSTGLSLLVVVVHGVQTIRKHDDNMQLHVVLLTAVASATSAGVVLAVVSNDIIGIHYATEIQNSDSAQENTYIGIPYCLAMLAASALLHFSADIYLCLQLYTPMMKKFDSDEEVNDIPNIETHVSCNETELGNWDEAEHNTCNGTTHDSCNENTVMINGGIENPVYSEKL